MEEITLSYTLKKPILTQAECDAYAAMAQAVNEHNAACGDSARWMIQDSGDVYEVAEVPSLSAEEQAAQDAARKEAEESAKKQAELETVPGRVSALESENDDMILMMADLIGGKNDEDSE